MTKAKEHWTANYGKLPGCLSEDTLIDVILLDGDVEDWPAGDFCWQLGNEGYSDIVAWRRA